MDQAFRRIMKLCVAAALAMPLIGIVCSQASHPELGWTRGFLVLAGGAFVATMIALALVFRVLRRTDAAVDAMARGQVRFLDTIPERFVGPAIALAAALSLFFELTTIRWQGSVFKFFDIYKNIGLLACFLGLGLGYALARRAWLPLVFVIPLFCLQTGLLTVLDVVLGWRAEVFLANPVKEQVQMGLPQAQGLAQYVAIYAFMVVVFLLSALTFVPVGQACGRLMLRRPSLPAYGANLLGSLLGVVATFVVAALWTPPAIWFAVSFAGLLLFHGHRDAEARGDAASAPPAARAATGRSRAAVLTGAAFALLATIVLSIQVPSGWERIYSPYQLIERGPSRAEDMDGLSTLTVAGKYYQRILDLSDAKQATSPAARSMAHQYDLPYRVRQIHAGQQLDRVAVMGAGTGNDVAAALRAGARHVDAIEIDPAILRMGTLYHPEQPYQDARVRPLVNDARTFLRASDDRYDMIVYGLLDAQTLLSHGSSVRLDSFVYTVEALREARAHLNAKGMLALSFAIVTEGQGRKIYRMIEEAFDGAPPVCVETDIGDVVFLKGVAENPPLPPSLIEPLGFVDVTAEYADPSVQVDVSTDDWPFLYMQRRVYPVSYLAMLVVLPLLALLLIGTLMGGARARRGFGHPAFFFLGAGFMLVETKGITELGLTFGNTWQVIGVVIMGVLLMAWLANLFVEKVGVRNTLVPYVLLIASLAAGVWIAKSGGLPSTAAGRAGTVLVLTGPLFFSGLAFSTVLRAGGDVSGAMASNLLGAMCGGLLEYNSMYFGFRFLYWIGMALYLLAWITTLVRPLRPATPAAGSPDHETADLAV